MASANIDVSKSISSFTYELYKKHCPTNAEFRKNYFVCPVSIYAAFSMIIAGAKTGTRDELLKALFLPKTTDAELLEGIRQYFSHHLRKSDKVTLESINGAFMEENFAVFPAFIEMLKTNFDAEHQSQPFKNDPDGSLKVLNQWISKNTHEKIKDCLPEGFITTDTAMVLLNAIYFKGAWIEKFDVQETKPGMFRLLNNTEKEVQFMQRKDDHEYCYFHDLNAAAIRFPFNDEPERSISMLVILPDAVDGLPDMMAKLLKVNKSSGRVHLQDVADSMMFSSCKCDVKLPRFRLGGEELIDLEDVMKKMGIKKLFTQGKADLSGVSKAEIFLSKAKHMALLEVTEEGAEAAAITVHKFGFLSSAPPPQPVFHVDHPFFVALITMGHSGAVPLFLGHCSDPMMIN